MTEKDERAGKCTHLVKDQLSDMRWMRCPLDEGHEGEHGREPVEDQAAVDAELPAELRGGGPNFWRPFP